MQRSEAIEDRIVRFDTERGDYEVEAALRRGGIASRWLQALAEHGSYWGKRVGLASVVTALIGGLIGTFVGVSPWRGALMGMLFPPIVAVAIGGGLAIGYAQVLVFVGLLYGGFILLHGSETSTPGRWLDVTPRRWSLQAKSGTLELHGAVFRKRLRLARASRLELARASDGTHALWLRVGWRWVRLVGTRPGATGEGLPSISGFAVGVARSVALPIRCHP
jgi:hypothetical protein